jgi:hypothetical protein
MLSDDARVPYDHPAAACSTETGFVHGWKGAMPDAERADGKHCSYGSVSCEGTFHMRWKVTC